MNSDQNISANGWALISAEERALVYPGTFHLPPLAERQSLSPGDAAKLLFDIETKENGQVIDRGVDRMWVIVKTKTEHGYLGILDSDPGHGEKLMLRPGSQVIFEPQHVVEIGQPPRSYIVERYGASFLQE